MSELLLEWMSYRGKGSKQDLPAAIVGSSRSQRILEGMAMLGHLDLDRSQNWQVCVPVLAGLTSATDSPVSAILCGARTPALLDRLSRSCQNEGAELAIDQVDAFPARIVVCAEDTSIARRVALSCGIRFQEDAAFYLLAYLPRVNSWPRRECPMPRGRVGDVRRFSRSKCGWVASDLEQASAAEKGLFRIKRDWNWITVLKQGVANQAEIDVYAGRLSVAAGLKKLKWDPASCTLRIPFLLRPPLIICRGLTLCHGTAPDADRISRETLFKSVPLRTARLAEALTGLRFA